MPMFRSAALSAACAALLSTALPSHAIGFPVTCAGVPFTGPATVTIANGGYLDCRGPVAGAVSGAAAETAFLAGSEGFGQSFVWAGKSDDAGNGPFASNPSGSSGVLAFDTAQRGPFVVALQGGPSVSYYLFSGQTSTGIGSLNFDTNGLYTAAGIDIPGPAFTRAGLYVLAPIPEPASMALMAAGLAAVGWATRRRRPS